MCGDAGRKRPIRYSTWLVSPATGFFCMTENCKNTIPGLVLRWEAPGVEWLEQRITLFAAMDGPEGFQFAVHGIARVSAPVDEDGLRYDENIQADTDLYYEAANGRTTYFGAAFMALTESAGAANPDGHIYIYGLQSGESGPAMVVARVPEARFADFAAWRFWNGAEWTAEKEQVVPIADEISCEFSVTPMSDQWEGAAYAVVFQEAGAGLGNRLSMYVGASPVGPFADPIRLYACAEPDEGKGIYVYNAKAHPHLSRSGELLASYNMNTTSMDMHMQHAGIYRPRFVNIRQIR